MRIISSLSELNKSIQEFKGKNQTIGFVPTMGALHDGHISLINKAKLENDVTIVSVFVNPTQFNNKIDLEKYPRTLRKDTTLLKSHKVDVLFAPSEAEMYPHPDVRTFEFGNLDKVMEGKYRPGHFNGVAQIVYKLLTAVKPDKAYFGEKDFQQVVIIQHMVRNLHMNVTLVVCPIVREPDGLAMSSRNMLLSPEQHSSATLISKVLSESRKNITSMDPIQLKVWVIQKINQDPNLEVEYFEIVNDSTLMPVESWNDPGGKIGCIAVKIGHIRLIDNIRYNS